MAPMCVDTAPRTLSCAHHRIKGPVARTSKHPNHATG
eukprot:COSAG02_NODE_62500_length_265_cov_1.825301_1_plen_36_part_10